MSIHKKRIRNLEKYVLGLKQGEKFHIALDNDEKLKASLIDIGFTEKLQDGETTLPKIKGPVSRFNAQGGFIRLRQLPKETLYREQLFEWTDWGGNHHSKIVYIPYERFQRRLIPPPAEELTLATYTDASLIISRQLIFHPDNHDENLHAVNLFLELFGECRTVRENLDPTVLAPTIRLNWQLLPSGEYPWDRYEKMIGEVLKTFSESRRTIISNRFETIEKYAPEFRAKGTGGFSDYMIFGFPKKGLFLMESLQFGNATYVLNKDWEAISKLTKAEIINENLHYDRIIHKEEWPLKIQKLLK